MHMMDNNGRTALMWAADNGHLEVIQLLLQHEVCMHMMGNNGRTALMWAALDLKSGGEVQCKFSWCYYMVKIEPFM